MIKNTVFLKQSETQGQIQSYTCMKTPNNTVKKKKT